jgi:indole-3-glycerol phosphate synthase
MSESFLERMAAGSRQRLARAEAQRSEAALLKAALGQPAAPPLSLTDFDIIAELKLHSPSEGQLADRDLDPAVQVTAYANGGAAAISVLTEPDAFHGSLERLEAAAQQLAGLGRPVMRKDFLVAPYQVLEARLAGAGGVLLILAMLDDGALAEMLDCASQCGLFVLLEAFDGADLERAATLLGRRPPFSTAPVLVGVNSRNLKTLQVDTSRFEALAGQLPEGYPAVAESGLSSAEDMRRVARLGYRAALVGSALMRGGEPQRRVAELKAAGGEAVCPS